MSDVAPTTRIVIDQWSTLSHKQVVGDPHKPIQGLYTVPSWVPAAERRRLAAYIVRLAYRSNVARLLLNPGAFDTERRDHREYGDAELIVDRFVSGVLGQDWSIIVDGADDDLADMPELPDQPDDPGPDAAPWERRVYEFRQARFLEQATAIIDAWEQAWTARPTLQQRQDDLREWAAGCALDARIVEADTDAAGVGDSVIVLWPRHAAWPRVEVFDATFYFPVLDDDADEDYPTKVHLAWEINDSNQPDDAHPTHVRRITFELVDLTEHRIGFTADNEPAWLDDDGELGGARLPEDLQDEQGRVYRMMPWALDADGQPLDFPGPLDDNNEPTTVQHRSYRTCLVTDARWPLTTTGTGLVNLDPTVAEYRILNDGRTVNRLDLGFDFLPVIHLPNTPSGKVHYGRSAIDLVAQLLDDLAQLDTDVISGARFLAGPVVALSNAQLPRTETEARWDGQADRREGPVLEVQPGVIYELGPDGSMTTLDLSAGIKELLTVREQLVDRLFVNARIPAEVTGRIPSSKAVSGVAMALAFSPFAQVIGVARMARDPKYRLLFKFGARLAQLQRVLPPGPDLPARLQFGSFMPADADAAVTMVAAALQAHAISLQTAVAILMAHGLPIDDAQAEVDRIVAEDTASALQAAEATASEQVAADRLGIDLPPGPRPPVKIGSVPGPPPVATP